MPFFDIFASPRWSKGVLCTANKKKGGGSARFHHSARCASKWRRPGWSRFQDHAPEGSAASQNLYFFQRWRQKLFENAGNANTSRFACKNRLSCLRRSAFSAELKSSICWTWTLDMDSDDEAALYGDVLKWLEWELRSYVRLSLITLNGQLPKLCFVSCRPLRRSWSLNKGSSPICESAVVDLVDLVMSRDHQNDNAVWLCRVTKEKKELKATKGPAQSAFEPTTIRGSKVSRLYRPGISESTTAWWKKIHRIMVTARECSILGQEKVCGVLLTKLDEIQI